MNGLHLVVGISPLTNSLRAKLEQLREVTTWIKCRSVWRKLCTSASHALSTAVKYRSRERVTASEGAELHVGHTQPGYQEGEVFRTYSIPAVRPTSGGSSRRRGIRPWLQVNSIADFASPRGGGTPLYVLTFFKRTKFLPQIGWFIQIQILNFHVLDKVLLIGTNNAKWR